MRIFIGCSTSHLCGLEGSKPRERNNDNINKENSLAKYLYDELKKEAHRVEAWWQEETIKDGMDFFNRIHMLSHSCDSGIFILNDETKIEDGTDYVANSNVLVELGMFISVKGLSNVIFISDKNVTIPSDFASINVNKYDLDNKENTDRLRILNNVKGRLSNITRDFPTDYINATVHFNYDTTDLVLNKDKITQSWNSKSAYLGYNAAKIWRDIELNPDYLPADFKYEFRSFLEKIKGNLSNTRNIISLGSGIGTLDEEVLQIIPFNGPIKYIPVEINPYLAVQALHRGVRSIINLNATYALIDDFEEQTSQIHDFIKNKIVRTEEESLYLLLGGTFCNLDNQNTFLTNWSKIIDSNDHFLLDAFVMKDGYCVNTDLDLRIKNEYTKPLINNAIEHKFSTTQIFRNSASVNEYLKLSWNERQEKLYEYFVDVEVKETSNDNTLFIYRFKLDDEYKKTNVSTLFKVKRHNFAKLQEKIGKHFDIDNDRIKCIEVNEHIERIYFLCKQKNENDEK